jgi:LysR family transcriptional regulator, nitrogen assimilation regulatory protein
MFKHEVPGANEATCVWFLPNLDGVILPSSLAASRDLSTGAHLLRFAVMLAASRSAGGKRRWELITDMDLRQLRYVVQIADSGSLSRAAEVLNIAQPALSQHVRNLELELGVELFIRHSRGMLTSDIGAMFIERARQILQDVQDAKALVRGQADDPSGEIRIGLPTTVARTLSLPLVTALEALHPHIRLHIIEGMSGHLNEWVGDKRLEIALLYDPALYPHSAADLTARPLLEEPFHLVSREDGQPAQALLPIGELEAMPLVLPGRPHAIRALIDRFAEREGIRLGVTREADSLPTIIDLVAGGAWTLLPEIAVYREVEAGRLRLTPLDRPPLRRLFAVWPSRHPQRRAIAIVLDTLFSIIAGMIDNGRWQAKLLGSD